MKRAFNLEEWLKDRSKKVVTRDGRPVKIVCWDRPGNFPIMGYTESDDNTSIFATITGNDYTDNTKSKNDIFFDEVSQEFIDEYQFNSILHILNLKAEVFKKQGNQEEYERWCGYYDWFKSKKELIIPDQVVGDSALDDLKPQEKSIIGDGELTEFEKEVKDLMESCCNEVGEANITDDWAKSIASSLFDVAKKEIEQTNFVVSKEMGDDSVFGRGLEIGKEEGYANAMRRLQLHCTDESRFKKRLNEIIHGPLVKDEELDKIADELLNLAYSRAAFEIALQTAKTWEESFAILESASRAYRRGKKDAKTLKEEPLIEDTVIFQRGVEEGRRLEREDIKHESQTSKQDNKEV